MAKNSKSLTAASLAAEIIRSRAMGFELVPENEPVPINLSNLKYAGLSTSVYLLDQLRSAQAKSAREILLIFKMRDIYIHYDICHNILRHLSNSPALIPAILNRMSREYLEKVEVQAKIEHQLYIRLALGKISNFEEMKSFLNGVKTDDLTKIGSFPAPTLWRKGGIESVSFFQSLPPGKQKALTTWFATIEENEEFHSALYTLLINMIRKDKQGVYEFKKEVILKFSEAYVFPGLESYKHSSSVGTFEIFSILPVSKWQDFFKSLDNRSIQLIQEDRMGEDLLSVYALALTRAKKVEELTALMSLVGRKNMVFDRMAATFQVLGFEAYNKFVAIYLEQSTSDFLISNFDFLFKGSPHNLSLENSQTVLERMRQVGVGDMGLNHPTLDIIGKSIINFLHPNAALSRNKIWQELYFKDKYSFEFWSQVNHALRRRRREIMSIPL